MELSRKISASKLIETIKANSSRIINTQFTNLASFSWQNGYGVFSVDQATYEPVANYIQNQKEHHSTKTFKEEFIQLLKRSNIAYDERYLWD